jgi:Ser/Thr protein kinase RdoA (MazF antagonist)
MPKRALGRNEAVAMGSFLARLHHALHNYERSKVAQRPLVIEPVTTLSRITTLEQLIRARPTLDALDHAVVRQLTERRDWVERAPENDLTGVLQLEQQVTHGDYQEANLFFDAHQIVAIIDWDQAYVASCAWEIVRTLDLVFTFAPALSGAFLNAYRAVAPLDLSELEIAASAYSLMRLHDLWTYDAVYKEGNDRVRAFMPVGGYTPLVERWRTLRSQLSVVSGS